MNNIFTYKLLLVSINSLNASLDSIEIIISKSGKYLYSLKFSFPSPFWEHQRLSRLGYVWQVAHFSIEFILRLFPFHTLFRAKNWQFNMQYNSVPNLHCLFKFRQIRRCCWTRLGGAVMYQIKFQWRKSWCVWVVVWWWWWDFPGHKIRTGACLNMKYVSFE